ncbi:MAG: S-layer homology domain-containing protein [Clostridia bacterium]
MPVKEGLLEKEKALEIFKDRFSMDLCYMPVRSKFARYMTPTEVKLAYMPSTASGIVIDAQTGDSLGYNGQKLDVQKKRDITLEQKQKKNRSMNIDAFSGKLLNYDGYELDDAQSDFYEIIKGSPVEKELSILAFQNIIDTGSFKPDREITYMELLRMLVNAKGYHPYMVREQEELLFKNVDKKSENYSYLIEAVRYGIIENKPEELKLDAKVTREQMAEWIVKLLKYEKLAKAKDIFVSSYKDADEISSDLKGHAAIFSCLFAMSEKFRKGFLK